MFLRTLALSLLLFAPSAFAKDTVAVLYFDSSDANPELSGLKVGLAQMLITDLTGDPKFDVVEREQLQAILDEQKLGHDGITSPETAAKIGKLLGAQKMLMGGYFKMGAVFRVDARMVDVETSKIIAAKGINGRMEDFMSMEAELASFAAHALQGTARTSPPPAPAPAPVAPSPRTRDVEAPKPPSSDGSGDAIELAVPDPGALEAAVAFSDGLIFMDAGDGPKARESFEKALVASATFEDAKLALAKLSL